jgi:SagB-type dehydrogenase family enzyme
MINQIIRLPPADTHGQVSLERTLFERRSVRNYKKDPLKLDQVGQLLWSAQGVSGTSGRYRTAPSAGATYPLELMVAVGRVEGLAKGVYRYIPGEHVLKLVDEEDVRGKLSKAALSQSWVREGAIVVVFNAVFDRTARVYYQRAVQYVHIEAGHASQNLHLQAVALDLGTVVIGAFDDEHVSRLLGLSQYEQPLIIMPVGKI